LPLIFVIDELKRNNSVVDWVDYINYTIEKGWGLLQTMSKIEDALIDDENKDEILIRLRYYLLSRLSEN
jgi:hypothetical protein